MSIKQVVNRVRENAERVAKFESGGFTKALPIFIKSGEDPAQVSFIGSIGEGESDEPFVAEIHTIAPASGKGLWVTTLCEGNGCPKCKFDKKKFRTFFTVVDHRSRTYNDKIYQNEVRYLELSTSSADPFIQKLTKFMKKNKLSVHSDVLGEITKYGSGKDTKIDFEFEVRDKDNYIVPDNAEPIDFHTAFGGESVRYD